jgi:hypothetical protein
MTDEPKNIIRQLTRQQRRVLGTLMEKGFTTPDQYPMTLKGITTGCNQKSNRDPITEYTEGEVADALEELRELGLVAEVFTDGGRSARYRHYMRLRFDFTEQQHAIICELLLRGRQQPGELRTRASRMIRLDSQEQLKAELQGLADKGFLQASDSLDRRGVEVDHTFYSPSENMALRRQAGGEREDVGVATVAVKAVGAEAPHGVLHEIQEQLERMQGALDSVRQRLDRIERELGLG